MPDPSEPLQADVVIYTDGGVEPNPGAGGWGAILLTETNGKREEKEILGSVPNTTNNRMEMTAMLEALKHVKKTSSLIIYTDSKYLQQGIGNWSKGNPTHPKGWCVGWKQRGWKRRTGKLLNPDLWQELWDACQRQKNIKVKWVRGHDEDHYNERCDELATQGRINCASIQRGLKQAANKEFVDPPDTEADAKLFDDFEFSPDESKKSKYMTKDSSKIHKGLDSMTGWLRLERLEQNTLPLPQYETEFSAGIDFAACLTRPCKHVKPTIEGKEITSFICCEPTLKNSYPTQQPKGSEEYKFIKRHRASDDNWQDIQQTKLPQLLIQPGETVLIPLGFKSAFAELYNLSLHVRSSIGLRGIVLANGTGIIDSDYRGEVFAAIHNRNREIPVLIEHGQRIVQGIISEFNKAIISETEVDITGRGEGGFGSTGTH